MKKTLSSNLVKRFRSNSITRGLAVGFASAACTATNNTLVLAGAKPRFHARATSDYLITFAVSQDIGAADVLVGRARRYPAAINAGGLVVAAVVAGIQNEMPGDSVPACAESNFQKRAVGRDVQRGFGARVDGGSGRGY